MKSVGAGAVNDGWWWWWWRAAERDQKLLIRITVRLPKNAAQLGNNNNNSESNGPVEDRKTNFQDPCPGLVT